MPFPQLDRHEIRMRALAERRNKLRIEEDHVPPDRQPGELTASQQAVIDETVERIRTAREAERPVMLTFGAHAIKNGLAPVFIKLMEGGWITHLATNGAGIIHDWEYAFQGESSEDVAYYVRRGQFGIWHETGFYINLALIVGAAEGLGYGESVGTFIEREELILPDLQTLRQRVGETLEEDPATAAACADLLSKLPGLRLSPGPLRVAHPWKRFSVQAAAARLGIPLTGHPMIGHDIIYTHPMSCGAAIGRAAERDFLTFAHSVRHLNDGVYMSVGSAVMSPMVFEKSLSMAQNLALQAGQPIKRHFILVADLAESRWDWSQGEPPADNPDYYLRYNKTFSRMGGAMRYLSIDNRDLLLALWHRLRG